MIFINLTSENGFIDRGRDLHNFKGISIPATEEALEQKVYFNKENGILGIHNEVPEGCDEVDIYSRYMKLGIAEDMESEKALIEEEPLILVATRAFALQSNIKSYVKFYTCGDVVLVSLIYGYMEVKTEDGEFIPLTRLIDKAKYLSTSKRVEMTPESLMKVMESSSRTKYKTYDYSFIDMIVEDGESKGGTCYQERIGVFSTFNKGLVERIEHEKERERVKREKAHENHLKQRETFAKTVLNHKKKKDEEERNKKSKKKSNKSAKPKESAKIDSNGVNQSAIDFLKAVNRINK